MIDISRVVEFVVTYKLELYMILCVPSNYILGKFKLYLLISNINLCVEIKSNTLLNEDYYCRLCYESIIAQSQPVFLYP